MDAGAPGRATLDANLLDQRTAINMVGGWLWAGSPTSWCSIKHRYYGGVVTIDLEDLRRQLYQPMISNNSSDTFGIFAGGVWGTGRSAAQINVLDWF